MRPRNPTPATHVARAFALGLAGWVVVPWWIAPLALPGIHVPGLAERAALWDIGARVHAGEPAEMGALFPEGELFSTSFYGFTLVDVAVQTHDPADRERAIDEIAWMLPKVEAMASSPPFDGLAHDHPPGGVILAGHANLLRAGYAILGGTDPAILADFDRDSAALAHGFAVSENAHLPTFPGHWWAVDNLAALESLRLHDVLHGSGYGRAGDRFARWHARHLDARTGLMQSELGPHGEVRDGPRGCALSWSLAMLPPIAPALAHDQYVRYRKDWFVHVLGTTGVREWPPGADHGMDVDSGPVIGGIGGAASGFGPAAARANGDDASARQMGRALELLSFPHVTARLGWERFGGTLLLTDELALWGRTVVPWDTGRIAPVAYPDNESRGFWLVMAVASFPAVAWAALAAATARRFEVERPPSRSAIARVVAQILVITAWIAIPWTGWFGTIVAIATVAWLGRRAPASEPDLAGATDR